MRVSRHAERGLMGNPKVVALRCLIVDDNELFLDGARSLLSREGFDVVGVALNSADALRLIESTKPDVILVDVELGDENGFELAERISGNSGAHSHVILVSTHSEEDLAQLIEASPALGFIPKTHLSAAAIVEKLKR
jgi:DNA-binding NarL/FixJ family response regulator